MPAARRDHAARPRRRAARARARARSERTDPIHAFGESRFAHEQRHAIGLASLYALGHASVVVVLGVIALDARRDPARAGSIRSSRRSSASRSCCWARGSSIRSCSISAARASSGSRSRWMLVFDLARNAWGALQARIHGHEHRPSAHSTQYGPRTAFGVGMIHGIGAETGIAGAASRRHRRRDRDDRDRDPPRLRRRAAPREHARRGRERERIHRRTAHADALRDRRSIRWRGEPRHRHRSSSWVSGRRCRICSS